MGSEEAPCALFVPHRKGGERRREKWATARICYPHTRMPQYEQSLVTYLDILGFKNLIDQSAKDPEKVTRIIEILFELERQSTLGSPSTTTQNFSDLIIRAVRLGPDVNLLRVIDTECLVLAGIQCKLLIDNEVLIRGGICSERFYMEQGFVFGPALVKSYHLAEQVAVYPRIIIDRNLIAQQDQDDVMQLHGTFVTRGDDGAYFLDYLMIGYAFQVNLFPKYENKEMLLAKHKHRVEEKLLELKGGERVRQKALWLALYHNAVIRRLINSATQVQRTMLQQYLVPEQQLKNIDL